MDAVGEGLVILGHLVLILRSETLLQGLGVLGLLLYAGLYLLRLGLRVFVGLDVLLEVGGGLLQLLLLAVERLADVGPLAFMIFVTSFQ